MQGQAALLVLIVVLFLVMLIGHGMWVALAAVLRSMFGPPPTTSRPRRRMHCPGPACP